MLNNACSHLAVLEWLHLLPDAGFRIRRGHGGLHLLRAGHLSSWHEDWSTHARVVHLRLVLLLRRHHLHLLVHNRLTEGDLWLDNGVPSGWHHNRHLLDNLQRRLQNINLDLGAVTKPVVPSVMLD